MNDRCTKCLSIKPLEERWREFYCPEAISADKSGYVMLCFSCHKMAQDILNNTILEFIQPERLNPETSQEDVIVRPTLDKALS